MALTGLEQPNGAACKEECVNGQYTDPNEYMDSKILDNPKPVFDDELDEYKDTEYNSPNKLEVNPQDNAQTVIYTRKM